MKYFFKKAQADELEKIFGLYSQRVQWMDMVGIAQWNVTDYLEVYPIGYYREQMDLGNLYVLVNESSRNIASAAVLLQSDDRWLDRANTSAYYIHNLVTDTEEPAVGIVMMAEIEKLAIRDGKQSLRTDCAVDNTFLNGYYKSLGYSPAGSCKDGKYVGNRLEKELPMGEEDRGEAYDNEILRILFSRSSYRGKYQDISVPRKDLETIIKAGIAAPSGCNRQTPAFVGVDEPDQVEAVRKIFIRPSCQTAPAFIMVFTQKIAAADGYYYNVEDFAAATENMLLAIKALGYETCWYEGNVRDCASDLAKVVNMPPQYELVCLLPVGVAADKPVKLKVKKSFEERAWINRYR